MDIVLELYESQVKILSIADRLQLAQMIMSGLQEVAPRWTLDVSNDWSEEDMRDVTQASLIYATQLWQDEDDLDEAG